MHPRSYYETFMRYEASNEVFIAIPFTKKFEEALETVIRPSIELASTPQMKLIPKTVNRGTHGAPDIHEKIMDGIVHSRLVVADMTVQSTYLGDDFQERWQPNSNVAYEVGLAAAWRNPEDILLIHQADDKHAYNFDVQNLRHVPYKLGDPDSITALSEEIRSAIEKSRFIADRSFEAIYSRLPAAMFNLLHASRGRPFIACTMVLNGDGSVPLKVQALTEAIEYGIIRRKLSIKHTETQREVVLHLYEWTELGLRSLVTCGVTDASQILQIRSAIAAAKMGKAPAGEQIFDVAVGNWTLG